LLDIATQAQRKNGSASGVIVTTTAELIAGQAKGPAAAAITNNIFAINAGLFSGTATGNAKAPGDIVAVYRISVLEGQAEGFDAIEHDNYFLLTAA
jgi:hypothetical protein